MLNRQILSVKHPWKWSSVVFGTKQSETLFLKKKKANVAENLEGVKQGVEIGSETVFLCCWQWGDGADEKVLWRSLAGVFWASGRSLHL